MHFQRGTIYKKRKGQQLLRLFRDFLCFRSWQKRAISSDLMPPCHLLLAAFVYYCSSDKRFSLLCCCSCRSQRRLMPSSSCCHRNEISESQCLIYSIDWASSWRCFDLFIIPESSPGCSNPAWQLGSLEKGTLMHLMYIHAQNADCWQGQRKRMKCHN